MHCCEGLQPYHCANRSYSASEGQEVLCPSKLSQRNREGRESFSQGPRANGNSSKQSNQAETNHCQKDGQYYASMFKLSSAAAQEEKRQEKEKSVEVES